MKHTQKTRMNENGLSLVEVVASIVILTLLLTTFMMMFIQSAKMNKASEEIVEGTYIAQTAMENIYGESAKGRKATLGEPDTSVIDDKGKKWDVYKKTASGMSITVKLNGIEGYMDHVVVEVREVSDTFEETEGILRAQMQNIIVWGGD